MGIDFTHFGVESSMVLQKFAGMYESIYWFNSKQIKKKEKYGNFLKNGFKNLFCLRSNISNDDIIYWRAGLRKMKFFGLK